MSISDLLVKIGFSNNKASVYLACLELGSANANEIAKKANIVRTTVYKILEELNSQGLIEEDAKSRLKIFKACPPQKIIDNLNQQKNLAESFLPDFINIFSETKFKPKLKFYDNQDGVKRAFEDILNYQNITVMTFSPIKDVIANFGKTYSKHFRYKGHLVSAPMTKRSLEIDIENNKKYLKQYPNESDHVVKRLQTLLQKLNSRSK